MTRPDILEMLLALSEMGTACTEIAAYLDKGAADPALIDDVQLAAAVHSFTVGCENLTRLASGRAATAPTIPAPPPVLIETDPERDLSRLGSSIDAMVIA